MANNIINESFFIGSKKDWLNQIPEDVIDSILEMLCLDPDKAMNEYQDEAGTIIYTENQKEMIWSDIANVANAWGGISATESETSPAELLKYAEAIKKRLSKASEVLEGMECKSIFKEGSNSKEFLISKKIRRKSQSKFVSDAMIWQNYESTGEWKKYYSLDYELEETIAKLQKISQFTELVIDDLKVEKKGRGLNNLTTKMHDNLIQQLCVIHKKYNGSIILPNVDGANENKVRDPSKIVAFLKLILPHTGYKRALTDSALHKKLYRMPENWKSNLLDKDTVK